MNFDGFSEYAALESGSAESIRRFATEENVGFNIVRRALDVRTQEDSKRVNRRIGRYVTFDCGKDVYSSMRAAKRMESSLVETIKSMLDLRGCGSALVIGLGNGQIACDSLGFKVFDKIEPRSAQIAKSALQRCVFALSTGVFAKTGVETSRVVLALAKELKPSFVVLVDSLATGSVTRVGRSFQLSTAGLSPGKGVGESGEKIDKSLLGVPVLSIGVPTILTLPTTIYGVTKEYLESQNMTIDEYAFRNLLAERKISDMIVAPKNVDMLVEGAAVLISNALNLAFA